ncbi:MAG: SLBB domain-containing protein, partial [Isosphaeraceae bacterium]
ITSRTDQRSRTRRGPSSQPRRIRKISDEGLPIPPQPSTAVVSNQGGVKVTIEVQGGSQNAEPVYQPVPPGVADPSEQYIVVDPAENNRVYVDVAAYNTKTYYVDGDVGQPGRLPCTGHETVLDAINYGGGLSPTADVTNVRLVRPARGGKPAKIYQIDYKAILEQGDAMANLQVLPGDRLIVGRHPTVAATVELDRMAGGKNTVFSSMITYANAMRALANINQPYTSGSDSIRFKIGGHTVRIDPDQPKLDDAQRTAIIKAWAEFWSKSLRIGVSTSDDKAITDQILKHLAPKHPLGPEPAKSADDGRKD